MDVGEFAHLALVALAAGRTPGRGTRHHLVDELVAANDWPRRRLRAR